MPSYTSPEMQKWQDDYRRGERKKDFGDYVADSIRNQQPPKAPIMNLRALVAISDDTITTVKVRFAPNDQDRIFLCKKDLAKELQPGMKVAVDTSRGKEEIISIAFVVGVDEESDIDPDSDAELRWLFGRAPTEILDGLKAEHEAMLKDLVKVRKQGLKERVRAILAAGLPLTLDGTKL